MRIISTDRYNELTKYEKIYKQTENEIRRKEFLIARLQVKLNTIKRDISKLTNKPYKAEMQKILDKIKKEINN